MRRAIGCVVGVLLSAAAARARADAEVAIVIAGPPDERAARHVGELLDARSTVRTGAETGDERAWIEATCGAGDVYVVALAVAAGRVRVARCEDRTVLSRTFDPAAAAAAPFAIALVAVELLELAREAPLAEREVGRPPPPRARPPSWALFVGPSAGIGLSAPLEGSLVLFAPVVGAELLVGRSRRPWRFGVALEGIPIAQTTRALDAGQVRVRYRRSELTLRPTIGVRRGPAMLLGWIDLSVAWVSATARLDGVVAGEHRRFDLGTGAGVGLRVDLGLGIHLQLGLGIRCSSDPVRYLVRGVPSIDEGVAQVRSMIALGWTTR